ncbi:MAG: bifunctional riboflavin kinase/FAD synthetase [Alphaproteobacteria bacterium]
MQRIDLSLDAPLPQDFQHAVIALGNFDGVHLGHQHILNQTKMLAKQAGARAIALSFEPHPRQYFDPKLSLFRLTPAILKADRIAALGLDGLMILPFKENLAKLSPQAFIDQILIQKCKAKQVVVGHDFHFGQKRQGSPDTLKASAEFETHIISPVTDGTGQIYASSAIRQMLETGDIKGANKMLGASYRLQGKVIYGLGLAKTLGFPTANLELLDQARPAFGVYGVKIHIKGKDKTLCGVANYGIKPTIGNVVAPIFEVYCFDFDQDLYGEELQVDLCSFIRFEQKFNGVEALKDQITQDCTIARAFFA